MNFFKHIKEETKPILHLSSEIEKRESFLDCFFEASITLIPKFAIDLGYYDNLTHEFTFKKPKI